MVWDAVGDAGWVLMQDTIVFLSMRQEYARKQEAKAEGSEYLSFESMEVLVSKFAVPHQSMLELWLNYGEN